MLNADMSNVTYQWNVSFKSQSMVSHVFSASVTAEAYAEWSLHQSSLMESRNYSEKISTNL